MFGELDQRFMREAIFEVLGLKIVNNETTETVTGRVWNIRQWPRSTHFCENAGGEEQGPATDQELESELDATVVVPDENSHALRKTDPRSTTSKMVRLAIDRDRGTNNSVSRMDSTRLAGRTCCQIVARWDTPAETVRGRNNIPKHRSRAKAPVSEPLRLWEG